jgi:hypothetical protein
VFDGHAKRMLKYIELKTGYADNGPAWIAQVQLSKSKTTVYFNGKALARGNGVQGNHVDLETHEEYWISGVKKDGTDRHWAGAGVVWIEASVVDEYLRLVGQTTLDPKRLKVVPDLPATDIENLHLRANESAAQ